MKSSVVTINHEGHPLGRSNIEVGHLPDDYIAESIAAIRDCARLVMFPLGLTHNNRDLDHVGEELPSVVAAGEDLVERLPWFESYYRDELRSIVSDAMGEEALCLNSMNEALIGLVFGPGMRIEAHTDVWAINANLFLKSAIQDPTAPDVLQGGTIIGHTDARSHSEILEDPIAILAGKVGTLGVIAASKYPHTIGVPETPANFTVPDITADSFWTDPRTRISLNVSYSTNAQLQEHPRLIPMTMDVGYSIPVLGLNK